MLPFEKRAKTRRLGLQDYLKKKLKRESASRTNYRGFTKELRDCIKRRDCYTCQICRATQEECKKAGRFLVVHHINHNKHDSDFLNLITLCNMCHAGQEGDSQYWENYFHHILE